MEVSSGLLVFEPCCADGIRMDVGSQHATVRESGIELIKIRSAVQAAYAHRSFY